MPNAYAVSIPLPHLRGPGPSQPPRLVWRFRNLKTRDRWVNLNPEQRAAAKPESPHPCDCPDELCSSGARCGMQYLSPAEILRARVPPGGNLRRAGATQQPRGTAGALQPCSFRIRPELLANLKAWAALENLTDAGMLTKLLEKLPNLKGWTNRRRKT